MCVCVRACTGTFCTVIVLYCSCKKVYGMNLNEKVVSGNKILMSSHNISFYGEMEKIIPELSTNSN